MVEKFKNCVICDKPLSGRKIKFCCKDCSYQGLLKRANEHYANNTEKVLERVKKRVKVKKKEIKIYKDQYYQNNKEEILEKQQIHNSKPEVKKRRQVTNKSYRDTHKEEIKINQAEYRATHKEEARAYRKQYAIINKDKIKLKKQEDYEKDKERIKKRVKLNADKNKDKIKKRNKLYNTNNRDKINKNIRFRYEHDINFRLTCTLSKRIRKVLKGQNKSKPTLKLLGCTPSEFKKHIEDKFTFGMNWKNYGFGWHIDHIRPCASFDLTKESEQIICFNYKNMQPLWALENIKKSDKF